MSRVLEVPYGQLGDMSKRQAMNLSVLRVDDGANFTTTYDQAKSLAPILPTTSPNASLLRSQAPSKFSDPPQQALVRDVAYARWQVVPLAAGLTLDEVLQQVVKLNTKDKADRILKMKVRFTDASEITFVRQDVNKPATLKYSGFYSALAEGTAKGFGGGPNGANPLVHSASAAFQKRGPVRLPSLGRALQNPTKEHRNALFDRFDPNGNGLLSLAELDKAVGELWPTFNQKPALMRAYKAADVDGSGLLGKNEFEHFLRYLVNYNNVFNAFRKTDANDDRRVSQAEFVAGAKRLEPSKSEAELITQFKRLDKNDGGFVLFEEFCDLMVKERPNVIHHIPPQPLNRCSNSAPAGSRSIVKSKRIAQLQVPSPAKRKQLFARFDPNGNGLLSLAELDKAVGELWPQFNNKPALMRAYKSADANGTGFVGRKEFEYFLRYLTHYNNLWSAFMDSDANNDRRINMQEFLAVRNRLQVGSEAEARSAFLQMDRNNGGYVLFEEFCDWMATNKAKYELTFTPQERTTPKQRSRSAAAPQKQYNLDDLSATTGIKMPSVADREALWQRADFNGNGMLSLAEIDKLVVELWPQLNKKPALMRAYKAADKNGTGFVSKREWSKFLAFLVHYVQLWATFDHIDSDDDRRIDLQEFLKGAGAIRIRKSKAELEALFRSIDTNDGGIILFNEFCAALAELKAQDG